MKLSLHVATFALALAASGVAIVSCADSDPSSEAPVEPDASIVLPVDAADAVEAGPEASRAQCDAGDPTCTSEALPCSATDFCPVTTPIAPHYAVNAVWGSSSTSVWFVGSAGTVARWNGSSVELEPPATTYTLNAIWGSGPESVWAVSTPDVVLRRGASGVWEKLTPAEAAVYRIQSVLLRTVWGPQDGSAVFVGGDRLSGRQPGDPGLAFVDFEDRVDGPERNPAAHRSGHLGKQRRRPMGSRVRG